MSDAKPPPPPPVVVGIDVGAETTKAVLGPSLGLEIVRNAHGGHATPSAVTFRGRGRLVGEDAAEARNADANTVLHVGRLLLGGEGGDDPLRAFYRFRRGEGGSVEVELDGARREFVPAAVLAMLLSKVRRSVGETVRRKLEGGAGGGGGDARYVLALPPDLAGSGPVAAAVLDAAYAAGCGAAHVRVVSSADALAAVYGNKFGAEAGAEAGTKAGTEAGGSSGRAVLVVDMGHAQTTVFLLSHGGGPAPGEEEGKDEDRAAPVEAAATVLSTACSSNLGAGSVDARLWRHFCATLPSLAGIEASSRRGQRLLDGCRRLKKTLAMLPSGSVTIETLGENDADVKLDGTRDLVRELCKAEADSLASLIARAVEEAEGVGSASDVAAVEVLGGGCRIPFVQEAILKAIGRTEEEMTLSRSLDDTSAAMGAALLGVEDDVEAGGEPVDADSRKALLDAEQAMEAIDEEMAKLSDTRNKMEANVLELRSARHGKNGGLLPQDLDAYLTEVDDWLFSDECENADLAQMEAKLVEVMTKLKGMCAGYHEAIKKEAEETERQMQEEAERAKAERDAAGDEDDEDHDNRRLPKKRRMEIMMKNKAEANELYKDKNYKFAAARYVKALSHCSKFHDLSPEDKEEVDGVKASLSLNLSLAYCKLERYEHALRSCNDALQIDSDSVKGLFRRASIYLETKNFDLAKKDVEKALELAAEDAALKKLQARIERQLLIEKKKEAKMARKMFG